MHVINNFNGNVVVDSMYNYNSYTVESTYRLQVVQNYGRSNLINNKVKRKLAYNCKINRFQYTKGMLLKNERGDKLYTISLGPFLIWQDIGSNVNIMKNRIDIPFINTAPNQIILYNK